MSWGLATEKWPSLAVAKGPQQPVGYMTNLTATSRDGTTVTGDGVANTKGAYAELIASTGQTGYGLYVYVRDSASPSAANTSALLDIATGAAASETIIVPNLNIGNAPTIASTGGSGSGYKVFYFPGLSIASSSRLSARLQCAATSRSFVVIVAVDPMISWNVSETSVITYGADTTDSGGVATTPASGSFGNWAEIGTTSRIHNVWNVGYDTQGDVSLAATQSGALVEIGYGPDSGSVTSIGIAYFYHNSGEAITGSLVGPFFATVASGTKIWARVASNETEVRGVTIHAV